MNGTAGPCQVSMFICTDGILFCIFFQFSNNFLVTRILKVSESGWGCQGDGPTIRHDVAPAVNGRSNIPVDSSNEMRGLRNDGEMSEHS